MKKFLLTIISTVALFGLTPVAAADSSDLLDEMSYNPSATIYPASIYAYIGIEGGAGWTHWKIFGDSNKLTSDNGIVGRVFVGYDFNRYFAIEAGYSYFFNTAKRTIDDFNYNEMKTQVIDLLGKFKIPANEDTNFYAKFGIDFLMTNISKTGTNSDLMAGDNRNELDLAYGVGVDYSLTPNVVANLEWLRYGARIKVGDGKIQPYTDAIMVGLRYKFGI